MLVTPEQLAVEDETWDAKDADLISLLDHGFMVALPSTREIRLECRSGASRLRDDCRDRVRIVNIQLPLPEPVEDQIVIRPEYALFLRIERSNMSGP